MIYPTPEQKFEGYWKFVAPEIRKILFQIFKEGIVFATGQKKEKK